MTKEDIQQLIAKGQLSRALEQLPEVLPEQLGYEVIQLQNQLSNLERDERMGLLKYGEVTQMRSKISLSVLKLLNAKIIAEPPPPKNSVKSILFAAANPTETARLETDKEFRTIKEEMKIGSQRQQFVFLPVELAVRTKELMRSFKAKPAIVHFSGHGEQNGIMVSTDENEEGLLLNDATIDRLFKPLAGHTELVLLNSCYSAYQAELISRKGMIVIGHNLPVSDKAALSFSKGFYLGLSEGMSYEEAFNDGYTEVLSEYEKYANAIKVWKDGEPLNW